MLLIERDTNKEVQNSALMLGLHPLQSRILANRLTTSENLEKIVHPRLNFIASPKEFKNIDSALDRFILAIKNGETIGVLTDYDADGITSHLVIYKALNEYFGVDKSKLVSIIGNRLNDGYGISQGLVEKILQKNSELEIPISLIISADCGSTDEVNIAELKTHKIDTLVTDHHTLLDREAPKSAVATINPNQPNCPYPDKSVAGCMVAWLFMAAVRSELIKCEILPSNAPHIAELLSFVAIGTLADCVSLGTSFINRSIVNTGLDFINNKDYPAWQVLKDKLKKSSLNAEDLAFSVAPRINATSRVADPYAALHFLQAEDIKTATEFFTILDSDNQNRKDLELKMLESAFYYAQIQIEQGVKALTIYLPEGHSGVAGIVAARLVEKHGMPCMVFTTDINNPKHLVGSARSIEEIDILKVLTQIQNQHNLFIKFGGHKGAAGATIHKNSLVDLQTNFSKLVHQNLNTTELKPKIYTDGSLHLEELCLETMKLIKQLEPYGKGFESPVFADYFEVLTTNMVGNPKIHMQINLAREDRKYQAIWFRAKNKEEDSEPVKMGERYKFAYTLSSNTWKDNTRLQFMIKGIAT